MKRLLGAGLLIGCGVAGHPIPPGPLPPAAPRVLEVVSTPGGLEVHATAPTTNIDGDPLTAPAQLLLFVDDPRCAGQPAHASETGPLRVGQKPTTPVTLRVAAAVEGRRGPPAAPISARWSPPPPQPDAPIGFSTPEGAVQIAWLPPKPPATEIIVLRDGQPVGRAPAAKARFIDRPSRGTHRYAIIAATPNARSAPSKAVAVITR